MALRRIFLAMACLTSAGLLAQGKSSAHAYLYLDGYGARFECLLGVSEMMDLLGKQAPGTLTLGGRQEIREASRAHAQKWLQVKLDGIPATRVVLSPVTLVKGVPGRTERPAPMNCWWHRRPCWDLLGNLIWRPSPDH